MLAALALLIAATPASVTSTPVAPCAGAPAALPAGMAGWATQTPARAAARVDAAIPLPLDTGVTAALLPTSTIAYAVRPQKPGGPATNGGIFAFDAPTAGRYRMALGSAAWIDVLDGKTPAVSIAHAHGPACSTIRKMVDFDLRPGRHIVQVAGNGSATLPMMVSRLP